jgi:hypothetical protein
MVPRRAGVKCERLPRKERSEPSRSSQQSTLYHPQDKCNIMREKKRKKEKRNGEEEEGK